MNQGSDFSSGLIPSPDRLDFVCGYIVRELNRSEDSVEKTSTALGGVTVKLLEVARPPQAVYSRRMKTQERV